MSQKAAPELTTANLIAIFNILKLFSDGSRYVHAYYVYPDTTDESEAEVRQYREGYQMDPSFETEGFGKDFNEFLWQKRTYILGNYFVLTL